MRAEQYMLYSVADLFAAADHRPEGVGRGGGLSERIEGRGFYSVIKFKASIIYPLSKENLAKCVRCCLISILLSYIYKSLHHKQRTWVSNITYQKKGDKLHLSPW